MDVIAMGNRTVVLGGNTGGHSLVEIHSPSVGAGPSEPGSLSPLKLTGMQNSRDSQLLNSTDGGVSLLTSALPGGVQMSDLVLLSEEVKRLRSRNTVLEQVILLLCCFNIWNQT